MSAASNFKLAPTDLVYLYKSCKRCFYDKVRHRFAPPRNFSEHFTNADRAMRLALCSEEVVDIGVGHRFRVLSQGEWVESKPIPFDEAGITLSFAGKYDAVVVTEADKVFVVDCKTTTLDDFALAKFFPQLMSYVTAIEMAKAAVATLPTYVDGIAILVFHPAKFAFNPQTRNCGLYGKTRWVELPRKQDVFDGYLRGVAELLAHEQPPRSDRNCEICQLRFKQMPQVLSVTSP